MWYFFTFLYEKEKVYFKHVILSYDQGCKCFVATFLLLQHSYFLTFVFCDPLLVRIPLRCSSHQQQQSSFTSTLSV